jgi:F-type H+-transporting ATPase subunit b
MRGLFNPLSIALHVLNAAILFAAVYFLMFKPVRRFMDARRQNIQKEIEEAGMLRAQADAANSDIQLRHNAALADIASQIAKGREQAREQSEIIIEAAQSEARRIIESARREADEIYANNNEAMREFAASLAVDISAKILDREISERDNSRLIDEFLKEVG